MIKSAAAAADSNNEKKAIRKLTQSQIKTTKSKGKKVRMKAVDEVMD